MCPPTHVSPAILPGDCRESTPDGFTHPLLRRMKVPVSIVIPVKNEAGNLPRCLDAVSWADETFVVDSHSTDATCEIAAGRGANVVHFEFSGTWPKRFSQRLPFRPLLRFLYVYVWQRGFLDGNAVITSLASTGFTSISAC